MKEIEEELKKNYIKKYDSKMKRITINNLYYLIYLKCTYLQQHEEKKYNGYLLNKINNYINNVINENKSYYHILLDYYNKNLLDKEDLKFLL